MGSRARIPRDVETRVLIRSRRRCCLCWHLKGDKSEKKGQIAHLDGNARNNKIENLAFLCLEHHDQLDSRTSQSKGLTPKEAANWRERMYKEIERFSVAEEAPAAVTADKAADWSAADFLVELEELIVEGNALKENTRVERGQLRERFIAPRDGSRHYREPDRYIVDWQPFVKWRTRCSAVFTRLPATEARAYPKVSDTFRSLPCGKDQLEWGVATLSAARADFERRK